MLQNAYFLAKIGTDTAENEQHFAEICQKLATTLRIHDAGGAGSPRRRLHGERNGKLRPLRIHDLVAPGAVRLTEQL